MSQYFLSPHDGSRHQIFNGVEVFTSSCERMMLSYVELEPGAVVEAHEHPHEQVGILLEGELTFTIGDETATLLPGQMWRIPGGVRHRAVAGASPVKALDVFTPVRDDYL